MALVSLPLHMSSFPCIIFVPLCSSLVVSGRRICFPFIFLSKRLHQSYIFLFGLTSSSFADPPASSSGNSHKKTIIIAAVTVCGAAVLILAALVAVFMWRRKDSSKNVDHTELAKKWFNWNPNQEILPVAGEPGADLDPLDVPLQTGRLQTVLTGALTKRLYSGCDLESSLTVSSCELRRFWVRLTVKCRSGYQCVGRILKTWELCSSQANEKEMDVACVG
jgi:hypothetical protein